MSTKAASIQQNTWWPAVAAIVFIAAGIAWELPLLLVVPFVLLAVLFFLKIELKDLFWLLVFSLPLSTELSVSGSLSTDFPDEGLMLLLTASLFAFFLLKPALFPIQALKSSLFLVVIVQLLWMLIALFFSQNPLLSVKYILAKVWYIVPFVLGTLVFIRQKEDTARLSRLLIYALIIPIVYSLVRQAGNGFSFDQVSNVLQPFFRNHVNYSAMIVCLLPILYAWKAHASEAQKKPIQWLIILFLVALFFAYSRGAWLCVIVGAVTWWAIRKQYLLKLIGIAMLLLVLGLGWLIKDNNYLKFAPDFNTTIQHARLNEHMAATYQLKDVSTMERFYRWIAGFRMVSEEPLTGFGPNNFVHYYKSYTVTAFKTWVSDNEEKSSVHNYFLLTAIEQGLPGMLLFCLLLYLMFATVQKAYHRLSDPFDRTVALTSGVILSMIVTLNMLSDLIETDKIGTLFYLLIGILITLQIKLQEQEKSSS